MPQAFWRPQLIEDGKSFQSLFINLFLLRWNTVAVSTWLQLEICMRPTSFEQFQVQRQLLPLLCLCGWIMTDEALGEHAPRCEKKCQTTRQQLPVANLVVAQVRLNRVLLLKQKKGEDPMKDGPLWTSIVSVLECAGRCFATRSSESPGDQKTGLMFLQAGGMNDNQRMVVYRTTRFGEKHRELTDLYFTCKWPMSFNDGTKFRLGIWSKLWREDPHPIDPWCGWKPWCSHVLDQEKLGNHGWKSELNWGLTYI